jgi:hypothetical protein
MVMTMQEIDDASEQIKMVYACYGLAAYQAQCVERQLAILLATEYGPNIRKFTTSQYDGLLESLFKKTLGGLMAHLRKSVDISLDFEATLNEAIKKRNWLVHHYFWERAGHFLTDKGRKSMIDELREIAEFLNTIDHKLTEISLRWTEKNGITQEILQKEFEKLVQDANDA